MRSVRRLAAVVAVMFVSIDQRVQTAAATASVVHTSAGIRAAIRAAGCAAATAIADVGTPAPDVGQRLSALGRVDRRNLGAGLTGTFGRAPTRRRG